ncbi:(Fe-S)-binding protein [Pseudalkalibacillus decolorationis]|uniref:(Fe-S)-binding protein n=1 Tax=Pseudalkalibacillus decolorationis TaxID=163879 RepID=UPI0021486C55|nr:(Fe-S)-binding protein [Pseudalkalibacillus decolorationis]
MEVLFWVGCAASYDMRLKRIAVAFSEIMKKANVSFAILGNEEKCTGDIARRMGDEDLYQNLASSNIQTLNEHGVTSIVTTCPHCFNMFKNEYPKLGGQFEVTHYTTFIYRLIQSGRLIAPQAERCEIITYHDPCYLGRQNGIYEEPRSILEILGYEIKEMEHTKDQSLCCGAGGGMMFQDVSRGEKINNLRAKEAVATGASTTATGCPFCLVMMEEAIGAINQEKGTNYFSRDIAEIVNDLTEERK